jgi:polyvinyl alcohol dehydrogenase (cytochrome)
VPDPPVAAGRNTAGARAWGPSGAAIWVTPTVDAARRAVYVGTSNAYSPPASPYSDAIVAFDLDTGAIRWSQQMTTGDVWNGSCPERASDHANCGDRDSPDFDFAASPVLARTAGGRELLIAAQKSGVVYALDPDRGGREVWRQRVGKGGTSGGVMWGPAVDAATAYVALSDAARLGRTAEYDPDAGGGLFALSLEDGRTLWATPAPACGDRRPCAPTQAAAVSAIPGVVFSGSNDGHLRAYGAEDGRIVWAFDTVRAFDTVNGVAARGGSINNGGPAIVGGMVFTNAGYSHHSGVIPGNVLLAFRVGAPQ